LERSYAECEQYRLEPFPLDEEPGLLPGPLTPALAEQVACMGMMLPFPDARTVVERCSRVALSEPTVRRRTYAAGEAAEGAEAAFVGKLEESLERPTEKGPKRQQVSADGAMVRLKGGEWKEVRSLVSGTVSDGKEGPRVSSQSYFSRLCDHDTFSRSWRGEFFRRGTENVRDVEAVMDGAEWLMQLVDEHCPEALRILDFTHAADAVISAAHAAFGEGTEGCAAWIGPQLRELRHGDPKVVLAAMLTLAEEGTLSPKAIETFVARHNYLARREDQIQYAAFARAGYCIGSGIGESANKHVVQARLKGAGMQWAPTSVNALLALRCAERSDRWLSTWSTLAHRLRRPYRRAPVPVAPPGPPDLPPPPPVPAQPHAPYFANGKPTRAHPYDRYPACHRAK